MYLGACIIIPVYTSVSVSVCVDISKCWLPGLHFRDTVSHSALVLNVIHPPGLTRRQPVHVDQCPSDDGQNRSELGLPKEYVHPGCLWGHYCCDSTFSDVHYLPNVVGLEKHGCVAVFCLLPSKGEFTHYPFLLMYIHLTGWTILCMYMYLLVCRNKERSYGLVYSAPSCSPSCRLKG